MSKRDQLETYLKQAENRLRLGTLLRGAAILTSVALMLTVVLVLITNAFAFSQGSMTGARVALFLALAMALGLGVALPLRALTRRRVADKAEAVFPQFQQRLVTFADRDTFTREPFIELLAADTLDLARTAEPARLAPESRLVALLAASVACLGALIWMIAAGPGYLGYGAARLWTGSPQGAAPFYDIRVAPGDATVRRHSTQTVTAQLMGFESPQVRLYARYQSASKWEEAAMQPQPESSGFQFAFAGVPEDVEYYVDAGSVRSRHFKIRVVDLPSVKQIRVTYHYPAWTNVPVTVQESGGDLRAVEGTEAEISILMDRPMQGGALVLENEPQVALTGGEGNLYKGTVRIEKDGTYHIAALDQGQLVRLSDDFFIEARKASPPEVSITRPGGDYRASPIEEVTVAMKAKDDYGLSDASLYYSVNGGPEHIVNMLKRRGEQEADGSTTLALEDFKLVPGDVVSVYAKAKDAIAESRSDILFIQAEPFEREYSQSQLAGAGGSGIGAEEFEISQRQKEIIAATWTQEGDRNATKQQAAENGKFLSGVQEKLRSQALTLADRLQKRELSRENEEFSSFQQDMKAAAEAMGPASAKLKQQKWSQAIPNEQKALQHLLRAEATFRLIQVAFGSRGGGGGGAGAGRDLANLLNLELDTEKNQFETEPTAASANRRAQEIDKALQKLDELARREQEFAYQSRNNGQSFQQRWQQEMLRREAEQLQKQMEQLAESSRQGQQNRSGSGSSQQASSGAGGQGGNGNSQTIDDRIQRALDQLRQASQDMRRAASQGQSAADARRAANQLQEARRLLDGIQQQQASGQLDSLAREADRLADQEREQLGRIRQIFRDKGRVDSFRRFEPDGLDDKQSKLADDRRLLADDVSRLEKAMQDGARGLSTAERDAASKLHQALGEMDGSNLESRLQRSAQAIRLGMDPGADSVEPAIAAGMERLREQLHEAQQALKIQPQQNPEEALNRAERLRSQIEALTRNSGNRSRGNGQPGGQLQGSPQAQSSQGSRGQRQAQGAQQGQGSQTGQTGEQGQTAQSSLAGNTNGGFQPGAPGGPRVWQHAGGPGTYIEPPGTGGDADSSASTEPNLGRAMRELDGLRRELRSEPESLADIQQLTRDLQRLGVRSFTANPALVEQLRARALATMDDLELRLSREFDQQESRQIRSGDSLRVPAGYQKSVAEYFRRLSKNR